MRERHTCVADGRCRNVLIDLRRSCGAATPGLTQCKCVDINPVRSEQIAVGALDAYVRLYDSRLLTLRPPSTEVSASADLSCIGYFAPGHISSNHTHRGHHPGSLATTYLSFSPCGTQLLVNMSGEHVYLYHLMEVHKPIKYELGGEDELPHLVHPPPPPCVSSYHPVLGRSTLSSSPPLLPGVTEDEVPEAILRMRDKGNELYDSERLTQAIQQYSSAITMCPNWHVLYANRATVYLKRNWLVPIHGACIYIFITLLYINCVCV